MVQPDFATSNASDENWGLTAVICVACCTYTGLYSPEKAAQVWPPPFGLLLRIGEAEVGGQEVAVSESAAALLLEKGAEESEMESEAAHSWADAWRITKQIVGAPDFRRITAANFLFICRSTLHLNFAAIFTEGLIPRSLLPLGSWQISLFYGACAFLPQASPHFSLLLCTIKTLLEALVVGYSPILNRLGFYRVIQSSFAVSAVTGLLALFLGHSAHIPILCFMFIDRFPRPLESNGMTAKVPCSILVHTFSPLMTLLYADFIDDDMQRHRRKWVSRKGGFCSEVALLRSPMSSLVFSMNALFTKPAQSLAPMLAVAALNQAHYQAYNDAAIQPPQLAQLQQTMYLAAEMLMMLMMRMMRMRLVLRFRLLCLCPAVLGALQWFAFRSYSLRHKHKECPAEQLAKFASAAI